MGGSERGETARESPEPAHFNLVINYRREDTSGHAGRLYDALAERFGSERVFIDIDAIDPGADFPEVIAEAVDRAEAFISLIGKRWLAATDAQGRRRLDNPDDFVRIEIETALQRDIRVIPVLVQNVEMPSGEDLPPSLRPLARRNALEIRDSSWRYDVDRLIATLEQLARRDEGRGEPAVQKPSLGQGISRSWASKRVALVAAGVLLLVSAAAVGVVFRLTRDGGGQTRGEPKPPPPGARNVLYAARGRVYAVGLSGKNQVDLTGRRGYDQTPAWSQDRERIAVARDSHIWIMRRDGTDGDAVTRGSKKDGSPAWSPDRQRIAFDRQTTETTYDVWLAEADGDPQVNLTPAPTVTGSNPDWSPDGRRIVFQRKNALWLMRADGSGPRKVPIRVSGQKQHPAWSPDGSLIAFTLRRAENWDIYVVHADGSALLNLTRARLERPDDSAWSPDSSRLVLAARDGLWLVRRDDSSLQPLKRGPGLTTPAWAP